MKKASIVFWKGQFIPENEAHVPITDRGFLFGDGVFTTMKVNEGIVEGYYSHIERFQDHCRRLLISPPEVKEEWVAELIKKNDAQKGMWRLKVLVTGGASSHLEMMQRDGTGPLITLKPYQNPFSEKKPLKLGVFHSPLSSPFARLKTLAYLDRMFIKTAALEQGCDDSIVCTADGWILETGSANLFWRMGNEIFYPDPSLPLLQGLSQQFSLLALKKMGFSTAPCQCTIQELPSTANVFACNVMMGPQPVSEINRAAFTVDIPLMQELHKNYQRLILDQSLRLP